MAHLTRNIIGAIAVSWIAFLASLFLTTQHILPLDLILFSHKLIGWSGEIHLSLPETHYLIALNFAASFTFVVWAFLYILCWPFETKISVMIRTLTFIAGAAFPLLILFIVHTNAIRFPIASAHFSLLPVSLIKTHIYIACAAIGGILVALFLLTRLKTFIYIVSAATGGLISIFFLNAFLPGITTYIYIACTTVGGLLFVLFLIFFVARLLAEEIIVQETKEKKDASNPMNTVIRKRAAHITLRILAEMLLVAALPLVTMFCII
ncbi:MAG: hypothetical protein Q8O83_03515 [bacterium]|nr:hypothetical protein [bacterium]